MPRASRGRVAVPDLDVLGPMQDMIRQIRNGSLTPGQLLALTQHRNPFALEPAEQAIGVATDILGAGKVVTAAQVGTAWEIGGLNGSLLYTETELTECATANAAGTADWRLMYIHGHSLRKQQEMWGTDTANQPCFYANSTWWLEANQSYWAGAVPEFGLAGRYHLLDFQRRMTSKSWYDQESAILVTPNVRAHEAVVAEAAFSVVKVTGERLLENWWHWGRFSATSGNRVCVGYFDSRGFDVFDYEPDCCGVLGVVHARNPAVWALGLGA